MRALRRAGGLPSRMASTLVVNMVGGIAATSRKDAGSPSPICMAANCVAESPAQVAASDTVVHPSYSVLVGSILSTGCCVIMQATDASEASRRRLRGSCSQLPPPAGGFPGNDAERETKESGRPGGEMLQP
jgi:hypothetical protein